MKPTRKRHDAAEDRYPVFLTHTNSRQLKRERREALRSLAAPERPGGRRLTALRTTLASLMASLFM